MIILFFFFHVAPIELLLVVRRGWGFESQEIPLTSSQQYHQTVQTVSGCFFICIQKHNFFL